MQVTILIPGKAQGKDRPRFVRATGRVYTPAETLRAEERIRNAWSKAGGSVMVGPLSVFIVVSTPRPKGHYLKGGELSAEGRRRRFPDNQKPDLDNVAKLCLDALNGAAFKDDVQVTQMYVHRVWSSPGYEAGYEGHTSIDIKEIL
jgi:Holliday junction resolvase RusA-like endonuclease